MFLTLHMLLPAHADERASSKLEWGYDGTDAPSKASKGVGRTHGNEEFLLADHAVAISVPHLHDLHDIG
jgi:hypothetical protein